LDSPVIACDWSAVRHVLCCVVIFAVFFFSLLCSHSGFLFFLQDGTKLFTSQLGGKIYMVDAATQQVVPVGEVCCFV
jgi:hypothetical protein